MPHLPSLHEIRDTADKIAPYIIRTPTLPFYGTRIQQQLPADIELWLKLELLQRTGSFKPRGALNVMLHMSEAQKVAGVTAFSAGNHAIATAFAASKLGLSAKVAMPATANPYRIELCREFGAEIVFADRIGELRDIVAALQRDEGRFMVHPFEGVHTTTGTATVGLEFAEDAPPLDAVVVPIGGGGLISGIAACMKTINPDCLVFGVEPEGAAGMRDSIAAGKPMTKVDVNTIADSLGAPMHEPYSFQLVKQYVDEIITVPDAALADMMLLMFGDLKLAVEPACAAALAAIVGPLHNRLSGRRVGAVLCGSNIDHQTFNKLIV